MYEWQRGSTMLTNRRMIFTIAAVLIFIGLPLGSRAYATSCEQVAAAVNKRLTARIDQRELTDVLRTLNRTDNRRLPPKFVTKREARERGWKPGRDLWSVQDYGAPASAATISGTGGTGPAGAVKVTWTTAAAGG